VEFGKRLREKREEKKYSLEFVEEETKIRKYYLQALENEEFNVLPHRVYASGFVKKYARFLGLNEQEMVEEYKSLAYGDDPEDEEEVAYKGLVEEGKKISYKNMIIAGIFLLVVIWLGNYLINIFISNDSDLPGKNRSLVQEPGDISSPDTQKKPDNNSSDIEQNPKEFVVKASLLIEAERDCWLNIIVDGNEEFTGILPAGENKFFEGDESIYIKAGNAGGIKLTFNGNKVGPLGPIGEVRDRTFFAEKQEVE